MDKPTVYIETSIVSYLAARPSRDPITARNQRLTHEWWSTHRHRYALYTSQVVVDEATEGDPLMASLRSALLAPVPLLASNEMVKQLAEEFRRRIPLPPRAGTDASHLALGTHYGMAYLLTWNCKHIANPRLKDRIGKICSAWGYQAPEFLTPAQMPGV